MTLTRLLMLRNRLLLTCWPLTLIGLCCTLSTYEQTYPTAGQRRTAVELAQQNPGSTLLYGRLPDPGAAAQMFAWEIGAFVTILAAVMAVITAVAVTRAAEDDGSLELLRGCGVTALRPLYSALTILTGAAVLLAAGCGVAITVTAGQSDGVSVSGTVIFAAVVGVTFLTVSAVTVLAAQVAPSAGQARLWGFGALGVAFALRAVADTQQVGWLNWVSPLGLRAVVEPFTVDRWTALLPGLLTVLVLVVLAVLVATRREFGAGLLRRRDARNGRLRVHGMVGLQARLARPSLLVWTVTVAAIGTLFAAMGSGAVEQQRDGEVGGFLGAQLGTGDPAAGYLAYRGTVIGIVVSVFAILSVLAARHAEDTGLTGQVLATGVRRWAPVAAQAAVAAAGCAVVLAVTGVITAVITPMFLDGDDIAARSLAYALGQWPTAAAMIGCATLLIGALPRLAALAWLPLAASSLLALLGNLLGVPDRIQDLGFFQHVPDIAAVDRPVGPLLWLAAAGTLLVLAGSAGAARRDLRAG
jgi:ABC-2 type transport system permease protein